MGREREAVQAAQGLSPLTVLLCSGRSVPFVICREMQGYGHLRGSWLAKPAHSCLPGLSQRATASCVTIQCSRSARWGLLGFFPFSFSFFLITFPLAWGACWFPEKQANTASHSGTELLLNGSSHRLVPFQTAHNEKGRSAFWKECSAVHGYGSFSWSLGSLIFFIHKRWMSFFFHHFQCNGILSYVLVLLLIRVHHKLTELLKKLAKREKKIFFHL